MAKKEQKLLYDRIFRHIESRAGVVSQDEHDPTIEKSKPFTWKIETRKNYFSSAVERHEIRDLLPEKSPSYFTLHLFILTFSLYLILASTIPQVPRWADQISHEYGIPLLFILIIAIGLLLYTYSWLTLKKMDDDWTMHIERLFQEPTITRINSIQGAIRMLRAHSAWLEYGVYLFIVSTLTSILVLLRNIFIIHNIGLNQYAKDVQFYLYVSAHIFPIFGLFFVWRIRGLIERKCCFRDPSLQVSVMLNELDLGRRVISTSRLADGKKDPARPAKEE
jgi:hypothetical protein